MAVDTARDQRAGAADRPAVITVEIAFHDARGDAEFRHHVGIEVAVPAQLAGDVLGARLGIGAVDRGDQVLVVTVGASRRLGDTNLHGLAVNRIPVLLGDLLVTLAAGLGDLEAVDVRIGVLGRLQVVGAVTVGAHRRLLAVLPAVTVHGVQVVGQRDRQADEVAGDDGVLAMARAAHPGDVLRVRGRRLVRGRQHGMSVMAIRAGRRTLAAAQSPEAVDAAAVDLFDLGMAGAAAPVEARDLFLCLVGAVAREAMHLTAGEQLLVHRTRERLVLLGVTGDAGLGHAGREMRLVGAVRVVAGGAVQRLVHLFAEGHVPTALHRRHRTGVALLAELVHRSGRRRQSRPVRLVAGDAARALAPARHLHRVHAGVIDLRFRRVAGATRLLGRARVQRVQAVRVAPDAVAVRTRGRLAVAGGARAMVEVLPVALDRVLVALGAVHRRVTLVVRRIVVVAGLRVTVHAAEPRVDTGAEVGRVDADLLAVGGLEVHIAVAHQTGLVVGLRRSKRSHATPRQDEQDRD